MTRGEVCERGYENGRHGNNGSPLASRYERRAIGGGFGVVFDTTEYLRMAPHWIAGWRQAKRELDPLCGL